MRILIATRKAALGSSHYLGALLKGLAARGHECHLTLRGGPSWGYLRELAGSCAALSPVAPLARLQVRGMLVRVRPEVANVSLTSATVPVIRECLRAGVPVIATILARTRLERFLPALEQCETVVVLNRSTFDFYSQQYPSLTPKMHLSNKLVYRQRYSPGEPRDDEGFNIACVGRLSSTKGELALQAMEAAWLLREEIPGLTITVVGSGTRLGAARRRAGEMNQQARRQFATVCGGVARPEEIIRGMDVVLGAGFSAVEALACRCQVIGMGFQGLEGLVTAEGLQEGLAANFGDSTATRAATPQAIAEEIRRAYVCRRDGRDWTEQAFAGALNPTVVLDDLERLLVMAAKNGAQ